VSAIRADFQSTYLFRYILLGGAFLCMSLWFLYDGVIGYPSKLPIAQAYDKLRELEPAKRADEWQKIASERGWPREVPKKNAEQIEGDILGQYVFSALCGLVALPALIYLFRSRGTWVEGTEEGLTTSWGQSLKFADVKRLDKKKWAEKGIAKATYKNGSSTNVFVFDDFKYAREPLGKILRALEAVLSRDQIVGGPTELEADAQRKAEEQEDDSDVPS
jgi:hypothetical protein